MRANEYVSLFISLFRANDHLAFRLISPLFRLGFAFDHAAARVIFDRALTSKGHARLPVCFKDCC